MRRTICGLLFVALSALAQPSQSPDEPKPAPEPAAGWPTAGQAPEAAAPEAAPPAAPADQPPPAAEPDRFPSQLVIQPGTFITVRVNEVLSSDYNQKGDGFSATLTQPIVADGYVVAQRGQTIGGRVVEVLKAGRIKGTSRLGLQLTDLTLVDGHQAKIQTQLNGLTGTTSKGRDATVIGGSTATGAAIGAAAGWGTGAAIGAGAGAAAGIVGVLLTRGHPTVVGPEEILTFRLENPVTVSTERAPQAFRYVEPGDYNRSAPALRPRPRLARCGYGGWGCPPPPYFYGGPYWGPYPYFWGPSVGFFFGRGYHRRHW